ncbi:MAG: hypothetical protein Q9207_005195 [Kuettlingeria erythrocarpa]
MDPVIITPRLKLVLLIQAARGSPEFEWLHELRSDEQATWWSLYGKAKSAEDTEKFIKGCLPSHDAGETRHRVAYTVHELLETTEDASAGQAQAADPREKPTRFIGLLTLVPVDAGSLPLPESLALPPPTSTTTLTLELAYHFLPIGWNKGYATESISAVFAACRNTTPSFWSPFTSLYVRAIVNEGNPASLRVMQKTGMIDRGVYEWTGKAVFLAGEWTERSSLHICGRYLLE